MKKQSILIGFYASLILIGGFIGYLVAQSFISLIVASCVTLLLMGCSCLIWNDSLIAYRVAITVLFCLLTFFGYRFQLSGQLAPSGVMTLLTTLLLMYLFIADRTKNLSFSHQASSE